MRRFVFVCLSLLLTLSAAAQPLDTVYNYSCDFEDSLSRAEWNISVGPMAQSITNKWAIGKAINNGGEYAMYVSTDQGKTVDYTGSSCVILASKDIILRQTGADYTLSFDWIANGMDSTDGLYVAWVPITTWEGDTINLKSYNNSTLDADLKAYCLELNKTASSEDYRLALRRKSTWQTITTTISKGRAGKHARLVFIWRNATNVSTPPACIDNIVIADGRACNRPTALNITTSGGDSLHLHWKGDASNYEVGCYSYEKNSWQVYQVEDTTDFTYTDVPEGFCDFYVRTICWDTLNQEPYYSGKVMANKFIYYPDNHCIDYITLSDDNCYYSDKGAFQDTRDPITYHKGIIDYGSEMMESRHTHHYSKIETDPRTGGELKTVPDGEIASVRLGNWDKGAESEYAEFKFHVDTSVNPILIMKYAVVLENPGHDEGKATKQDPRFKLDVFRKGKSLGTCASADFTSSQGGDGWHEYQPASGTKVVWRDWSTVGVNLAEYHGETLVIRVTTYDCGQSGHYGYAYFTMGCDKAELNAETCDGVPITEFRAPAGFKYRWYRVDDPSTILSTEQTFRLTDSLDTRQYAVDIIYRGNDGCYFTLYTAIPRYPVADFDYTISRRDCKNYITFNNHSEVRQNDYFHQRIIHSKCDSVRWNLGAYTRKINPTQYNIGEIEFPQEGDTFQVSVRACVGQCDSIFTQTIYLPAIGPTNTDTMVSGCKGYPYTFEGTNFDGTHFVGHTYTESGVYQDTMFSSIGCDSIFTTYLTMHDTLFTYLDTLIRSDAYIVFKGDTIREAGDYVDHNYGVLGCDSFSFLHLRVHQVLHVRMSDKDSICANDGYWSIPYTIQQGETRYYSLLWDNKQMPSVTRQLLYPATCEIEIPEIVKPDIYTGIMIFHDSIAQLDPTIPDDTTRFTLKVQYPDTIITQRWNDLLSVRSAAFNGGFNFVQYQWYKNGKKMVGDTLSYYYEKQLDPSAEYSVLVTRPVDSLKLFVCAYSPQLVTESNIPYLMVQTMAKKGARLSIYASDQQPSCTATWYMPTGLVTMRQQVVSGEGLYAPQIAGIYLLVLDSGNSRSTHYVLVE